MLAPARRRCHTRRGQAILRSYLAAVLLAPAIVVVADAGDEPQEDHKVTAPALAVVAAEAADEPQGDDEVMQPTKRGLRLTPDLALGFSRMLIGEAEPWRNLDLTEEQQSRMAEVTARRLMQTGHSHGQDLQQFIEALFETAINHDGKFTPETARDFAKVAKPALPALRECLDGVVGDTRPLIKPDQLAEYAKQVSNMYRELNRFEGKMNRWAEGRAKGDEGFDHYEPEDGEAPDAGGGDEPKKEGIRHARRMAQWELSRIGPAEWARFLAGVKYFFKFTDEQSAKADQVLADYRQRAEAVMTDEWEKRVLRNRTKMRLADWLGKQPTAPWKYHLDREYEEAIAPLKELGQKFREEVLALASDEQREAALAGVREVAEKHGMTVDEKDVSLLRLTAK